MIEQRIELAWSGPPSTKKTSNRVGVPGRPASCHSCGQQIGRRMVFPDSKFAKAERLAVKELKLAGHAGLELGGEKQFLAVRARFFLAPRQRPDLAGLIQAAGDILETAGVITNDFWIRSWDGSGWTRELWEEPRTEIRIAAASPRIFRFRNEERSASNGFDGHSSGAR